MSQRAKLRVCLLTCLFAIFAGCSADDDESGSDNEQPSGKADTFEDMHPINVPGAIYGESVGGKPMVGESFGNSGPTLFLVSSIHGNERSAITFGERVRTMLLGGLAERHGIRIFFVQSANPDGIANDTRENLNFIDLNRNFPAENFDAGGDHGDAPLTEPESQMLHDALNATAPVGVVSIHCCIPTFDLDGPRIGLADAMNDAMTEESGLFFTLEDLPAFGGSMGSYVSQILEKPIITVEFDFGDLEDVGTQFRGMEAAIDAAARWTSAQEPTVAKDIDALQSAVIGDRYDAFELGSSTGGLPIRAELVGGGNQRKVVLLAGFDGSRFNGEYVAEHIRRRVVDELPESQVLIVNGVNPDGLGDRRAENARFVNVRESFREGASSIESNAVIDGVLAHEPEVVVVVVDSGRDAMSAIGPDVEAIQTRLADRELDEAPQDTGWLSPFLDAGSTVVIVEVASEYAESQVTFSDLSIGYESQSVVGNAVMGILR